MISDILSNTRYVDKIACLTNDNIIVFLYVLADVASALTLTVIGYQMWRRRRRGYYLLPHQCVMLVCLAVLFAAMYAMNTLLILEGYYRVDVVLRGGTLGILCVLMLTSCWRRA